MNLSPLDIDRASINPWSLTAEECAALRVLTTTCSSVKTAALELVVTQNTVNDLVTGARRKMKRPFHDYRLWADWATWVAGLGSSSVRASGLGSRPLPALLAPYPFRPWTRPPSSSFSSSFKDPL